jgi:general secretion pathway protein B
MSYILDALKKSDQQRNIGAAPTLQFAQASLPAPKRPSLFYYSVIAVVLLAAGVAIGLLRPWQAEHMPAENGPIAKDKPVAISQQAAPASLPTSPGTHGYTTQDIAAAPVQQKVAKPGGDAQQRQVVPIDDLPPAIRKDIPDMAVQLHAYSSTPSERLVSINSIRVREGGYLMSGLKLEEITPDGMIFSYKGYRFKRGNR